MAKPRVKPWVWVLIALAAGLALRLYFLSAAPAIAGDSLVYGDIAKNLLTHHVYGFTVTGAAPRPTLIRLPGYPLFLALCFAVFGIGHYQPVLYIQIALDLVTCGLLASLARRLFGPRAGMAALWLSALCPFTATYSVAALTETLTLFCIATSFYAMERWSAHGRNFNRWLWIVAASLAYSVLLRPEQGLLPAAVIPAMLWIAWKAPSSARSTTPVLVAALCVILPLLPWAYRNQRVFHVFQPLAPRFATDPGEPIPLGFQRWYRTWGVDFISTQNVYWNYDGDDIKIADLPNRAFDSPAQYSRTQKLLQQYDQTDRASTQLDQQFDDIANERIAASSLRYYIVLPAARLANMLLRPRTEMLDVPPDWWHWSDNKRQNTLSIGYAVLNLAYLTLAVIGFGQGCRRAFDGHTALAWSMAAYIVLRCALLLTLDNSEPRYTLEFFPILCVWAAALFTRRDRRNLFG